MKEEKFDVIIVGGGLSGTAAAYQLAKSGMNVLVIERGNWPGSKNMTGGRLYGHSLEKMIPGFEKEAPIERTIVKEKVSMLTSTGGTTLEFDSNMLKDKNCASYSVLRSKFDRWFAQKAEEAGALYITGILVDDLIKENNKICGVISGDDKVYADVVILAEGVNGILAQTAGLKEELNPEKVAVGVKETIKLDEKTICDRFGVEDGEGAAWMFAGDCTKGAVGGGFIYTNRDSISLGIVATVDEVRSDGISVPEMVERMKEHPLIQPLIKDGKLIEYSAHLVPEGGYDSIPQLYGDGILLVGDAASFVMNLGFTVRGMDLAIESGRLAAESILSAKVSGDYSANALSVYEKLLEESFVIKDMKQYRKTPELLGCPELFNEYPQMIQDILNGLFIVDGSEPQTLFMKALPPLAKAGGLVTLAKVGMKALEAL